MPITDQVVAVCHEGARRSRRATPACSAGRAGASCTASRAGERPHLAGSAPARPAAHRRRHHPPPLDVPAPGRAPRGRGAGRDAADRRPDGVPRPAHARCRQTRRRLGVAVLAASASSIPARRRSCPGATCRSSRTSPAATGRWSATVDRPCEAVVDPRGLVTPLARRLVARLVDRRRGPLARARPARRACASAGRRLAGGRDRDAGARRRRHPPRVRHAGHRGRRRRRARRRRDREPTPPCRWPSRFAVRPYNPEGLAVVERIGLRRHHRDRRRPGGDAAAEGAERGGGVDLPRRRLRAPWCSPADAGPTFPTELRDEAGLAQAAFVFPLPHRQTLRVALPLAPERRTRPSERPGPPRVARRRPLPAGRAAAPSRWPTAGRRTPIGACAWCCPTSGCSRPSTPTGATCCSSTTATRSRPARRTYHRFWFRDAAYLLAALDRYGFHARGARGAALATRAASTPTASSSASARSGTPTAPRSGRIAEHWRLHPGRRAPRRARARRSPAASSGSSASARRKRGATTRAAGPAARRASRPSTSDRSTSSTGTTSGRSPACSTAPRCCVAAGEDEAADRGRRVPRRADAPTSSASLARHRRAARHRRPCPAGPRRRIDPGVIGSLVGAVAAAAARRRGRGDARPPLERRPRPLLHRRRRSSRASATPGSAPTSRCSSPSSSSPPATAGPSTACEWMLDAAPRPTWTWPEAIHPRARRRLHGRRPPRLGGGRPARLRAHRCSCTRTTRRPRARVDAPDELVRPGHRGARRPDPVRHAVLRRPLARRAPGAALGARAARPRRAPWSSTCPGPRPDVAQHRAPGARRCSRLLPMHRRRLRCRDRTRGTASAEPTYVDDDVLEAHLGVGVGHAEPLEGLDEDRADGQVAVPLAVGGHDVPRRLLGRSRGDRVPVDTCW